MYLTEKHACMFSFLTLHKQMSNTAITTLDDMNIGLTIQQETRGPRGPWVAHLRKRSKVTVEPIIEIPRGII